MIVTHCHGLVFTNLTVEQSQKQLSHKILYTKIFSAAPWNNNFLFLWKTATHRGADGESSSDTASYQTSLSFTNGGIFSINDSKRPLQQNR